MTITETRSENRHRSRLALVGWGAIGQSVGRLLDLDLVDLVVVGRRTRPIEDGSIPPPASVITDPAGLTEFAPTVVAEAAGRGSVASWGHAALELGADFIISSTSALADPQLLTSLRDTAVANGASLHIQPGALGGVDALSSARLMGIDQVEHRIVKPPHAWHGTPAEELCDLGNLNAATTFFRGNAAETASDFPKNANVAMTTALAGIGPQATTVSLVADPSTTKNRHEIAASGAFGDLEIRIANNALPENPKTSAMAALNLTRAIHNRNASIII